ncbi:flavin reductase family protein [Actinomadura sp. WMMB 499]|uniref:flavin reductase family protein n=1 Tax=Actinomadura sp. WMMB 499 TaxID=1219491 RepID=UPI0012485436|nr:flavin reductase family protein [Actinomadura sp. WMMB 499]QFG20385.1 flavin reductase family protein [Actinomadura sp. WMMB 499]
MTVAESTGEIDGERMRRVLGTFCTGVVAITALDGGEPVGMACQSFASLSLDPPLVCFCPAESSTTWPRIRAAGRFAVNVLAADQGDVCRAMAGRDKFAGVSWRPGPGGSPLLDGALAWIEAGIERELPGGDHTIVIGRVRHLAPVRPGGPLLFFRGRFGALAA